MVTNTAGVEDFEVDIVQVAVAPDGDSMFAVNAKRDDSTTQSSMSPSIQGVICISFAFSVSALTAINYLFDRSSVP